MRPRSLVLRQTSGLDRLAGRVFKHSMFHHQLALQTSPFGELAFYDGLITGMRILTLSDKVEPLLYGPSLQRVVGDIDLVLSCGDLPDYYLDYVVTTLNVPCYFVRGNHAQGVDTAH